MEVSGDCTVTVRFVSDSTEYVCPRRRILDPVVYEGDVVKTKWTDGRVYDAVVLKIHAEDPVHTRRRLPRRCVNSAAAGTRPSVADPKVHATSEHNNYESMTETVPDTQQTVETVVEGGAVGSAGSESVAPSSINPEIHAFGQLVSSVSDVVSKDEGIASASGFPGGVASAPTDPEMSATCQSVPSDIHVFESMTETVPDTQQTVETVVEGGAVGSAGSDSVAPSSINPEAHAFGQLVSSVSDVVSKDEGIASASGFPEGVASAPTDPEMSATCQSVPLDIHVFESMTETVPDTQQTVETVVEGGAVGSAGSDSVAPSSINPEAHAFGQLVSSVSDVVSKDEGIASASGFPGGVASAPTDPEMSATCQSVPSDIHVFESMTETVPDTQQTVETEVEGGAVGSAGSDSVAPSSIISEVHAFGQLVSSVSDVVSKDEGKGPDLLGSTSVGSKNTSSMLGPSDVLYHLGFPLDSSHPIMADLMPLMPSADELGSGFEAPNSSVHNVPEYDPSCNLGIVSEFCPLMSNPVACTSVTGVPGNSWFGVPPALQNSFDINMNEVCPGRTLQTVNEFEVNPASLVEALPSNENFSFEDFTKYEENTEHRHFESAASGSDDIEDDGSCYEPSSPSSSEVSGDEDVEEDDLELLLSNPSENALERAEGQKAAEMDSSVLKQCNAGEIKVSTQSRQDGLQALLSNPSENAVERAEGQKAAETGSSVLKQCNAGKIKSSTPLSDKRKKYFCILCDSLVTEFYHHLKRQHKNDNTVLEILSIKNTVERRKQLDKLRNRGSFKHLQSLTDETQHLAIVKRRHEKVTRDGFKTCENCLGRYRAPQFSRHRCKFLSPSKSKKRAVKTEALGEGYLKMQEFILPSMRPGEVKLHVKTDPLIMRFGETISSNISNQSESHRINDVSQRLRELAKLVMLVKGKDASVTCLSLCLRGSMYDAVVSAIRSLAGFDTSTNRFRSPSVASKLGHYLSTCADMKLVLTDDQDEKDRTKGFIKRKKIFWRYDITAATEEAKSENSQRRTELPAADDVRKLNNFLEVEATKARTALLQDPSRDSYRHLLECTLSLLITFNRRRSGEVARMPLSAFLDRSSAPGQEEVTAALTDVEKKLEGRVARLSIRGKRGRFVPVLLTPFFLGCLVDLNAHRRVGGVHPENKHLFAVAGGASAHLRGCDVVRKMAEKCGAAKPQLLTSTKLRKHLATCSQLLALKENELSQLANFMGHTEAVHHQYYRLPEGTVQQTQISKILIALHQNKITKFRGRSLTDINVELSSGSEDEDNFEQAPGEVRADPEAPQDVQPEPRPVARKLDHLLSSSEDEEPLSKRSKKKKGKRVPLSIGQVAAIKKHLADCIATKTTPNQLQCLNAIRKAPELHGLDWKKIKFWIYNFNKSTVRTLDDY
ncbi:hypothetical protein ONE63_011589 [Megalurothrips usitatus]|uniref:Uncharacterized protein n=1 Tax=Megalurothrips usitatus TaxID=439358 RepID=A0AAV7WZK4_9NEOP|nr:hypothetical protein ONE63_011589 [Megalurothrips usitatus]